MQSNAKNKQILKIIKKLASGYVFDEVQLEYQKMQKSSENDEKSLKNDKFSKNFENFDRGTAKNTKSNDIMKLSSNIAQDCSDDMVLVKKKVTSHFVPPDIRAIKLLLEIKFEEDSNSVENLSDDELLCLKTKLLEEYANENSDLHETY